MTDKSAIIVKPSTAQAFETLWKRGRVLFFSAPCGFGKTVLADTLLDGRPVLRLNAADTGFALPSLEDTGHSQADMVTKVYAHILDEDRKVNAQKFESAFYANPDLRGVQAPAEQAPALDVQSIILQLQQSPELLSALTSLISNQGCK